jgi:hypothetical protein
LQRIEKNAKNKRVLYAVIESFFRLANELLIALRAIAKGYQIPFRANCMQNPRIACNDDHFSNIPWLGELNFQEKKSRQAVLHPRF